VTLAASFAQTEIGRAKVSGLFPFTDEAGAREALEETAQGLVLHERSGRLPLSGLDDPLPALDALAAAGGLGFDAEFRPLVAIARAAERTRTLDADLSDLPRIAGRVFALSDFSELVRTATRLFEPDGSLSDHASPKLHGLRTRLRRERQNLYDTARQWLATNAAEAAGETVVMREERYCVPVSAGAAPRVRGIVHDRSASGQTVFIEPLEIADANNALSLLSSDLRREEERIRREFGRALLSRGDDLSAAGAILAELDAIEARAVFAKVGDAAMPEFSARDWTISRARHPLLDRKLAAARQKVFGEEPVERDAVPLDIELDAGKRWLLVSGPNAGGKTVVLKTVGLFSMLAQSGFLLPASRAVLPFFRSFFTVIGDEQGILSDLSTFSSSMRRLAGVLREVDADSLALLDELGSGTDPEEGGAIAVSALETLLARGARAVVTTHLTSVKEFATSRGDAQIAAMEFDESTGRPTYRLRAGFLGRSRALATARDQGLPAATVARAEELLGAAWQRREKLESEAEEALARLRETERELAESLARSREREEKLAAERQELDARRRKILTEGRDSLDRARREFRTAAADAVAKIKSEKLGHAKAAELAARVEAEARADPAAREAEEEVEEAARALKVGDAVRLRGGSASGRIVEIQDGRARIEAGGKRLSVALADLMRVPGAAAPARPAVTRPDVGPAASEIHVIGKTVEEAIEEVDRAIDHSISSGEEALRVVHGHGTGRLRAGLRDYLRRHPAIASLRPGKQNEGGDGATVVVLK
jgi:DNA mismatch repair protein MutS2